MGLSLSINCQVQLGVFRYSSSFVWGSIHIEDLNGVF
jgi:hypothetical protein